MNLGPLPVNTDSATNTRNAIESGTMFFNSRIMEISSAKSDQHSSGIVRRICSPVRRKRNPSIALCICGAQSVVWRERSSLLLRPHRLHDLASRDMARRRLHHGISPRTVSNLRTLYFKSGNYSAGRPARGRMGRVDTPIS